MNDERPTMNLPTPIAPAALEAAPLVRPRPSPRGFSLIELIVVVTIIGILASIALVNVRTAQRKAREATCRENLFQLRKALDTYYADKQKYPATLDDLVPGYLRAIPADPLTMQKDWETIMEDPLSPEGEMSADPDPEAMAEPGIIDVKSRAEGTTLDNVPYADL